MADRSIAVRLRAEIGQYLSAMKQASQATKDVGQGMVDTSTKAESGFSRMLASAEKNSQAWTGVGAVLTAAGAGVTAFGAAALKTGIEYNTLQQTSRAALTSLLGSTQAAADQMDRLDDFARNSPFAKQTFIQAQQQMLAFGIETQKVIPYLDAVQNAVAAAGGSNADIEGIVATMSKIQSSAKVTAEDLNEFGNRGVNAAELIGSQMGMTGAQVREAITAGTLDATAALDALAAGMSTKFDGAADNVKDTFAGAMDRVKAAWRDFSAELATPLVNPNGGGGLVDLLNWAADTMRAFEALPAPIKTTASVVTGLAGVVSLLAGGLLLAAPRLAAFKADLAAISASGPKAAAGVKGLQVAAGAAAGVLAAGALAFGLWVQETAKAKAAVDAYAATLDEAGNRTEQTVERIKQVLTEGQDLGWNDFFGDYDVIDGAQKMGIAIDDVAGAILGEKDALERVHAAQEKYQDGWSWGWAGRTKEISNFNTVLSDQGDHLDKSGEQAKLAAEVTDRYGEAQEGAADSTIAAADAAKKYAEALDEQWQAQQKAAGNVLDLRSAQASYQESLEGVNKALKDNGRGLDLTTEKGRANDAALRSLVQDGLDVADSMRESGAGASELKSQMRNLRSDVLQAARDLGMSKTEAREFADSLGLIPKDVTVKVDANTVPARKAGQSAKDYISDLKARFDITGDQAPARRDGESAKDYIRRLQAAIPVTADDSAARVRLLAFKVWAAAQTAVTTITANVNRTVTTTQKTVKANAAGARLPGFPTGGRLPGTPPADKSKDNLLGVDGRGIPRVLVRSREWVVNEQSSDYYGDGIMSAINSRMIPREAIQNLAGLASGGGVGSAQRSLANAQRSAAAMASRVRAARERVKEAEKAERAAAKTDRGSDDRAAAKRVREAERRLAQLEKELGRRRDKVSDQRDRLSRLRDEKRDTRLDLRRGNIRESVTGGLSGAYGVVDDMRSLARSGDLTRGQSRRLGRTANRSETRLRNLYKEADRVEKKLDSARQKFDDLLAIRENVRSGINGGFSLADAMDPTQRTNAQGEVWYEAPTGKSMLSGVKGYASKARAFAKKIRALQEAGFYGPIVQEIAGMGVDEGAQAADALLSLSKKDRRAFQQAHKDIDADARVIGNWTTKAFEDGGVMAAKGLVKGLQSQEKAIESQITKIAKGMERALKKALGIKSPSRVMRDLMHYVGDGAVLGLQDVEPDISKAAANLLQLPGTVSSSIQYAVPVANVNPAAAATQVQVTPMSQRDIKALGDYIITASANTAAGVVATNGAAQDAKARYVRGY